MLVGEKMGPPVFEIASLLGIDETKRRINNLLDQTGDW
jgi:Anticodon binding domain